MLRLVLLLLYLFASPSISSHTKHASGWNAVGLDSAPQPPATDGGGGADPLG
jgi:hypothetical protein